MQTGQEVNFNWYKCCKLARIPTSTDITAANWPGGQLQLILLLQTGQDVNFNWYNCCKLARRSTSTSTDITAATLWLSCSSTSAFTLKCKKRKCIRLYFVHSMHFLFKTGFIIKYINYLSFTLILLQFNITPFFNHCSKIIFLINIFSLEVEKYAPSSPPAPPPPLAL